MTKFKVGQKVRVVGYNDTSYLNMMPIGTICEVVDELTAQGPKSLFTEGRWAINYITQAHKFEAVADEPQADATKDAVLAFIKDHYLGEDIQTQGAYYDMAHRLFGLDIHIARAVEFIPTPVAGDYL